MEGLQGDKIGLCGAISFRSAADFDPVLATGPSSPAASRPRSGRQELWEPDEVVGGGCEGEGEAPPPEWPSRVVGRRGARQKCAPVQAPLMKNVQSSKGIVALGLK